VYRGESLELTKLIEYGPYSEGSVTTLRVPRLLLVAPVQGEEEHGPPPSALLVSVRKEGNTPPCMRPLVMRLTVPVHRASPEDASRYAMLGGGDDGGGGLGGGSEGGGGLEGGGGEGDGQPGIWLQYCQRTKGSVVWHQGPPGPSSGLRHKLWSPRPLSG
jgi:uncharacterized membrane protein YgcG